ncbi:hypothetical protein DFH29DRAFT_871082 [Suillus ampliporus]|nr:hypothetical protein DFH29DRAFT_871082 [Suillus ampliporus]
MLEGASLYSNGHFIPARNNLLLQNPHGWGGDFSPLGPPPLSLGPIPLPEDLFTESAPQQQLTQPDFNMYPLPVAQASLELAPPPMSPMKPHAVNNNKENVSIETNFIAPRSMKIAINPLSTLALAAVRVSLPPPLKPDPQDPVEKASSVDTSSTDHTLKIMASKAKSGGKAVKMHLSATKNGW